MTRIYDLTSNDQIHNPHVMVQNMKLFYPDDNPPSVLVENIYRAPLDMITIYSIATRDRKRNKLLPVSLMQIVKFRTNPDASAVFAVYAVLAGNKRYLDVIQPALYAIQHNPTMNPLELARGTSFLFEFSDPFFDSIRKQVLKLTTEFYQEIGISRQMSDEEMDDFFE